MLSVYNEITFEDIDGGVWKQGWNIEYQTSQWSNTNKLNVIVIPHSHNDPGWLMTFEEYFNSKTKDILNTIVNALNEKENRKFVWAETSYLSLWWSQASVSMKDKMRRLIANGQLEIVTGGWVMNDEANTHYYSMIEQMIEGHEWLRANIDKNIVPANGWSIDPFGYSPTMAYLLKQIGFKNMLIQRVHYRIKKYLAQSKKLEFFWSQLWDRSEDKNSKIFTHVMPFYSYDVPHTCGPDPSICCQFDFRRMIDMSMSCPWGKPPVEINSQNVEHRHVNLFLFLNFNLKSSFILFRAQMLLDQYRKKNQLYDHNVVLVPLGDDFRYTSEKEAQAQYQNYEQLMDYMNSREDWNVNIKFGTLKDYFDLVREKKQINEMPVLSGDFFTYADRNDHYWSGYYTSRPLYKRLDRTVEYYLRTAEILYSFANLHELKIKKEGGFDEGQLYKKLLVARRNLGLFQHHDGITGTAKTAVNNDYGAKLLESIKNSQLIIKRAIEFMLSIKSSSGVENKEFLIVDDARLSHDDLTTRNVLKFGSEAKERRIYVFNSNEHKRIDVVTVHIDTPFIELYDDKNVLITDSYQVNLLWSKQQVDQLYGQHENDVYELLVQMELNPFEIKCVTIKSVDNKIDKSKWAKNTIISYSEVNPSQISVVTKKLEEKGLDKSILELVQSTNYKSEMIEVNAGSSFNAYFDAKNGLLRKLVNTNSKEEFKIHVKVVYYGVTHNREKSGGKKIFKIGYIYFLNQNSILLAYLFLPDGPAKEISYDTKWIHLEAGLVRNRVCTNLGVLLQCAELYPLKATKLNEEIPAVGIWNLADIRGQSNFELAINMQTDINNSDFYTDLNSFQFIRRKTYNKIPLQANVYPMPSGAYIQDSKLRLTALTTQTLGVNSLQKSQLEIFLDRRLQQDDNRGLEQPVLDNKLTSSRFVLTFEKTKQVDEHLVQPNLNILMKLFDLQHPLTALIPTVNDDTFSKLPTRLNLIETGNQMPCDVRVLNIRTMQTQDEKASNSIGLILHRIGFNCESSVSSCDMNSKFSLKDLFSFTSINEAKKTHLTFLNNPENTELVTDSKSFVELVAPMEIQAFRLVF